MSGSKHTPWIPGPWGYGVSKSGRAVVGDANGNVVCVVEGGPLRREVTVANAQLIAAAPCLAAALEAWLAWAAKNQANLYFSDLPESSFTQVGDLVATSHAALARVKGGELGEGWDEPYAHRDPGNARPARTARKAKGER